MCFSHFSSFRRSPIYHTFVFFSLLQELLSTFADLCFHLLSGFLILCADRDIGLEFRLGAGGAHHDGAVICQVTARYIISIPSDTHAVCCTQLSQGVCQKIQHKQASLYIELLQQNGTHMNASTYYVSLFSYYQAGILLLRSLRFIPIKGGTEARLSPFSWAFISWYSCVATASINSRCFGVAW